MHIGIDYGSKLAGTTVVSFEQNKYLHFHQSDKKKDADGFLEKWIVERQPDAIFMDAPLSLPSVYVGEGDDYFYRKCDREVRGMSPMFLGGLTARAMRLKSKLESPSRPFYEIYPAHLIRVIFPDFKEKKTVSSLPVFLEILEPVLPISLFESPKNWHQVDSILAWYSGWRKKKNLGISFGDSEEGLIWV
ncbi:DUF429 domain-containing protein [Saprospiraceae bacterium]|jgi:predicted nuclease with RNAse H fold|nr:DUF429 domain-containing protein [Bacteroidota bacterium]MDB4727759.1 DUF429 domain-containing protein [Saprospiraceae bacterium]MDF1864873.1 DUF429 domain-containing protein [Saprospiraceae bacterium]